LIGYIKFGAARYPKSSWIIKVNYYREGSGSQKDGFLKYDIEFLDGTWHPTTSKFTSRAIDEFVVRR
jgi:hypothetical protein